jgi:hypothetical protein
MKKLSAYEWGLKQKSCEEALIVRKALGPNKTQSDFYLICDRGDWSLWQLDKLPKEKREEIKPLLAKIAYKIADRAVRNYVLNCGFLEMEEWAENWLNGKRRTYELIIGTVKRATWKAAWEREGETKTLWAAAETLWAIVEAAKAIETEKTTFCITIWAMRVAEIAAEEDKYTELLKQANDIKELIPHWPGDD